MSSTDDPTKPSATNIEELKALSVVPLRKYRHRRKLKHQELCPICKDGREAEFLKDYYSWEKKTKMAEKYTLGSLHQINTHIAVFRLQQKRLIRTETVYEAIIEEGLSRLAGMEFKPSDITHAAQRLDKLSGREVDKHSFENGPPRILMIGIPQPGGVVTRTAAEELPFQGKVLTSGGPPLDALLADNGEADSDDTDESDSDSDDAADEDSDAATESAQTGSQPTESNK